MEENIQTTVYINKELHRRLKAEALAQDRSIKDIITEALTRYLDGAENAGR